MKLNYRKQSLVLALAFVTAVLNGCTSLEESYAGHDTMQVWKAMVAVAENPDYYTDWIVTENNVWADEAGARIEVQRRLERDHVVPLARPHHETRNLEHQILLLEDANGPLIKFTSRDWAVPMHARDEAFRYFDDVWEILGGAPEPAAADEHTDEHAEGAGHDEHGEHDGDEGGHDDDGLIDVDDVNS